MTVAKLKDFLKSLPDDMDVFVRIDVASLKKDNAELRIYNDKLLEENKKLKDKIENQHKFIKTLNKHFNIKCSVEYTLDDGIWARFVSIQSKQDEGTWDTTACANLVNDEEDFNTIEEVVKNDKN